VRVTFMPGKTTVSSSGTSSRLVKRTPSCSRYRNCSYSASSPAASRAASRCGCSSTRTTRPSRV
jgi:hypothetical protein